MGLISYFFGLGDRAGLVGWPTGGVSGTSWTACKLSMFSGVAGIMAASTNGDCGGVGDWTVTSLGVWSAGAICTFMVSVFFESSDDCSCFTESSGDCSCFCEASGDCSCFCESSGDCSCFCESSGDCSCFFGWSGNCSCWMGAKLENEPVAFVMGTVAIDAAAMEIPYKNRHLRVKGGFFRLFRYFCLVQMCVRVVHECEWARMCVHVYEKESKE